MFHKERDLTNLSKSLAWLLRHGACEEGFELSPEGYLAVDKILQHSKYKYKYSLSDIGRVVKEDAKQRYKLRHNPRFGFLEIKANQGHSIQSVSEGLKPIVTAKYGTVIHATQYRWWLIIKHDGLNRMSRNHIHFSKGNSEDCEAIVQHRARSEVLIYVDVKKALNDGIKFFESENGVILSPGNERGFLKPMYFAKVIRQETGEFLYP